MNKHALLNSVISLLETEYATAVAAASAAHETATHNETVAENKYDTFGLEASYLAHGQAQRVQDLENSLRLLKRMQPKDYKECDAIGVGALICLENENSVLTRVFLLPEAGGTKVQSQNVEVMVVTPLSPLGALLKGKYVDDEITMSVGSSASHFLITKIL